MSRRCAYGDRPAYRDDLPPSAFWNVSHHTRRADRRSGFGLLYLERVLCDGLDRIDLALKAEVRTVALGLSAFFKAVLVVIGVPIALVRLWSSIPDIPQSDTFALLGNVATWAHVVVLCVGEFWLIASISFVRELFGALRVRRTSDASTWSSRWASAIVGLLLVCSASSSFVVQAGATTLRKPGGGAHQTAPARASSLPERSDFFPNPDSPAHRKALDWFGLGTFMTHALACKAGAAGQMRMNSTEDARALCARGGNDVATAMLAPFADASILQWVDATSRVLWHAYHTTHRASELPDVRFVRIGPGGIELLLEHALPEVPWPFYARGAMTTWTLDPSANLSRLLAITKGCGRLLPCLIPLGSHGKATYLINLVSSRRLGLVGDPDSVRDVMGGVLVGLRTLPWAEELNVELLGPPPPALEEQCFQMNTSSVETLRHLACSPPRALSQRLEANWLAEHMIVIDQNSLRACEEGLADAVGRVAGMVTAAISGTDNLVLRGNGAVLEPFGIAIAPPSPSPAQLQRIDALLERAPIGTNSPATDVLGVSPGRDLSFARA